MKTHKFFNLVLVVCLAISLLGKPVLVQAHGSQSNPEPNIIEYPAVISGSPAGITVAPDGKVWFAEWGGPMIGRITPDGTVTEFYNGSNSVDTIVGPDGNIWFTGMLYGEPPGGWLGRSTLDGSITKIPIPTQSQFSPFYLTVGPDGNIWFTEGNGWIGMYNIMSESFTEYPGYVDSPHGITTGPDGNLWYVGYGDNVIAKMTLDGTVTKYAIPTGSVGPYDIVTGPDGNLWFVEYWGSNVGRITPDGVITEFPLSSGYGTSSITMGPDGNLWFTEPWNDKIGRITPDGVMAEYSMPAGSTPGTITTGPDGSLWISEAGSHKIARVILNQKPVLYVMPGEAGDCSSWANACGLQTALTTSISGDEIWVAAGRYMPATGTDRTATFQLQDGVALYGGFAGTETARDQRNPATNITILSGDLNGDDGAGFANYSDNSYHVITSINNTSNTVLDGFTITGGNATGVDPFGGGMALSGSNMTITNVSIRANIANYGGGMYIGNGSYPTITNSTISDNLAGGGFGGGTFNNNGGNPTFINVTFSGNSAGSFGGGISNYTNSNPTLVNTTFTGNSAVGGGAIYQGNPIIKNSIFWGNTAGGGPTVAGGQFYNSAPTILDSVVQNGCPEGGNCTNIITADPKLGMLGNYGGYTLTVPLLTGSSAIDAGNDATCPTTDQRGVARVGRCDIGAYEYTSTNTAPVITEGDSVSVVMSMNDSPTPFALTLNAADADSDTIAWSIVSPANHGAATANGTGNSKTIAYLPATDYVGSDSFVVQVDDGNGGTDAITINVTINATHTAGIRYVTTSGTGDCSTWANACDLQTALTTSISGDEIWVATGVYTPTTGTDRTVTFQLKSGVAVYGGFVGTENLRNQRNPVVNITILSGDIDNNDINTDSNFIAEHASELQGGNVFHVVSSVGVNSNTILDGFIITAGWANGSNLDNTDRGGGMYNSNGSPTLANLIFSANRAGETGSGAGGGMFNEDHSNPVLNNVTFVANVAGGYGGGLVNYSYTSPVLTNVTFTDNAGWWGGGMTNLAYSTPVLTNVTFFANNAGSGGGINSDETSSSTLTNVTITGGQAAAGGAICGSNLIIRNSIIWGTTSSTPGTQFCNAPLTVSDSVIQGTLPEGGTYTNIITGDPKLGTFGDHGGFTQTVSLLAGSSAIDAGNDATCPATDQRGIARIGACDIGAYEYTSTNSVPVIAEGESVPVLMNINGTPNAFHLTLHATDVDVSDTLTWSISTPASHGTANVSGTGNSKAIGYIPYTDYVGSDSFVVQVDDGKDGIDTITITVTIVNSSPSNWTNRVAAGYGYGCALTDVNGVKCWGRNYYGQLGNGTTAESYYTPVNVNGLTSGVAAVVSGEAHTCALTSSGGVKCWGNGESGNLGNGTFENSPTPVDVIGLSNGVIALTAGNSHTCALTSNGGVKCWGYGWYDYSGGSTTNSAPVDISGWTSGVVTLSAFGYYTCALLDTGEVQCMGFSVPSTATIGLGSDTIALATGYDHNCALNSSGTVKCWGGNAQGQLGDGTTTSSSTPVEVIGLPANIVALDAGNSYTCALTGNGGVKCWGAIGTGSLTPTDVIGLTDGVTAFAAGYYNACALVGISMVKCWGAFYNTTPILLESWPIITEGDSVAITLSQNGQPMPFNLILHATDTDADTLTWSVYVSASHGTANVSGTGNSKVIEYTPNTNYTGTDSFVVQVDDGHGGQDIVTVNITINPTPEYHPNIEVTTSSQHIIGRGWNTGSEITLSIDGSANGEGIDYTEKTTMQPSYWNPDDITANFELNGKFTFYPGDVITMTDGTTSMTYTVQAVDLTNINVDTNTASGTGTPGDQLQVCVNVPHFCAVKRYVVVDGSGRWTADFNISGNRPDEQETIDILPGYGVRVIDQDEYGNRTCEFWDAPNSVIWAHPNDSGEDWIDARDWVFGETLHLTIDNDNDPSNGILYTDSGVVHPANWNSSVGVMEFHLGSFDLKPGHIVTITGPTTTKTLVITNLDVTDINPDSDTISGTAVAGSAVQAWFHEEHTCNFDVYTDDNGFWTVDFNPCNIRPGIGGGIGQKDADEDGTVYFWRVPNPSIKVWLGSNNIDGYDWKPNTLVTVTVGNYSDQQYSDDWGNLQFHPREKSFTLAPGQIVNMTDGVNSRTHTVLDITVTGADIDTDIVTGTAAPNSDVQVCMRVQGCIWRYVTANGEGNWSANYAVQGPQPGEEQIWDIKPGDSLDAARYDNAGNGTGYDFWLPNPSIGVRENENRVEGWDWTLGATVTVEIDDPTTTDDPDPMTATVGLAPWNPNQTWLNVDFQGVYDIKPGDKVRVSDGTFTKEHTVLYLTFTNVDTDTDKVFGKADAGQRVNIWTCWQSDPCISRDETADGDGNWVTNFSVPGEQDWEQETADLRPGSWIDSSVSDEDGDSTMFGWSVLNYSLHAVPTHPEVHGHDWTQGDTVTLTITDSNDGVLYTQTKNADEDPWCGYPCFDLSGAFDLQVGQYVTMTDGAVSKTVRVSGLTITEVDQVNDVLRGNADPGSRVAVNIWSQDGKARYVTTDNTGHWVADFSVFGDEDFEQFTTDIAYGDNGRAIQLNPDGTDDGTLEYWNVDWVAPSSVPLVYAVSSEIDISVPVATVDNVSVLNTMNDSLFRLDQQNELQPLAAEGYDVSADGLTYTVHLRPGALWSDGEPVTAQDFVTGILRVLDPNVGSDYGFILHPILNAKAFNEGTITDPSQVGVHALDVLTLVITLERPATHFKYILAAPVVLPARQDVIDLYGDTWTRPGHYVSNGLYRLMEYDKGHILVEQNLLYNGPMQSHFSQIGFDVITDPNEQAAAYKAGNVDVLFMQPQNIVGDPELHKDMLVLPSPGLQYIGFTTQVFPTNNPLVRKALASAIDRHSLINDVVKASWRPEATGVIPPELPGYQGSEVGYSFDPAQALDFLKQADYENGVGFPTLNILSRQAGNRAILEAVAQQWQNVLGITVHIDYVSSSEHYQILQECRINPATCGYNVFASGWVEDYPDAYNFLNDLLSPDSPYNYTQWDNTAYRNYLALALSEPGTAQRISDLQEAEQEIVTKNATIAPLFYLDTAMVVRPGIYPYYGSVYFTNLAYWSNIDPADDGMTAEVVGSNGGTVTTENNTVVVDIPVNAVEEDVTLSVTDLGGDYQIADSQAVEYNVLNRYSVQPHGLQFNEPVTLTFAWSDADNDGRVDNTGHFESNIRLFKDGEAITEVCVSYSGCDMTANTISVQVTSLSRFELVVPSDATPPVITSVIDGTMGSNNWYTGDVTVTWTIHDLESGIASSNGCDPVTRTTDTSGIALTCSATNDAGLSSSASVTIKIDKTSPTLIWAGSINHGDAFPFGFVPPAPTCTATDTTSGVDGDCTVTGYSTAIGSHTLAASARDRAGNVTVEIRNYTVSAWTLNGFYQPVDMIGVYNLVKNGSTVPFKFEIFAGPTELTNTAYVKSFTYAQTTCDANAITDEIELTTTGDPGLRYDTQSGQFIYNWKTPRYPGKCYRVTMTAMDGTSLTAYFKLK